MPTEELDLYLDDAFMGDNEILCYMKHEDVYCGQLYATLWAWKRNSDILVVGRRARSVGLRRQEVGPPLRRHV